MKTPEPGVWHRTSPYAILFFLGRTVRMLVQNAWQSLAPLFALAVAYKGDLVTKIQIAGSALGILIVGASILSYWFFRFQLRDDSVLIRQGWIKKKQLDIKFDRIQGINTKQNPVYRLLGLVTVNFDTAGSAGNEGNLPAVTRAFSDSLREQVGSRRSVTEIQDVDEDTSTAFLVHLDWRDMFRIGLADRRALIVFAFIGPVIEQFGERLERFIDDVIRVAAASGIDIDAASGVSIAIGIFITLILLFIFVSVAAAFLQYHDFKLWLDGNTLRSRGGLITQHEHSMDLGKIQTLRLQQGIVQNWQRRFRMTARQAVASGKQRGQKVFTIPTVTVEQADQLRTRFLAPEAGALSQDPRSVAYLPVSPFYMRSRILFVGLAPSLLAVVVAWQLIGIAALLFLLWLPAVAFAAYRTWKRAGYLHDAEEIVRRSGFLGYRTVGLLFRKVQRVTVTQSRYQRRKGLASLRIYMASGSVRVPYIEHATAKQLRDYILYKVESSDKAWH